MLEEFYNKYIAYSDYHRNLDSSIYEGMYHFPHFIMLSINLLIWFFVLKGTKGKTRYQINNMLKVIAVIMLILEIVRMVWFRIYRPEEYFIRFDWCNQICLIMPICILLNLKMLYPYFMGMAFYGGFGVNIYPLYVFFDYGGLHLMSCQSMISHGLMLLSSFMMLRIYEIKNIKWDTIIAILGFTVNLCIAAVFNFIRGENYMGLTNNEGLPLVSLIPSPYHNIVMIPLEMFGLWLVLFVYKKLQKKLLVKKEVKNYELQESNNSI